MINIFFWYQNATLLAVAQNCIEEVARLCLNAGHDSFIRVTRLFKKRTYLRMDKTSICIETRRKMIR